MTMPGRKYTAASSSYRYGFNGKENDNEVKGEGNQQDYGMRIYDPRIGKFLSVDPLTAEYPMLTPYQFASNRPIDGVDQDGLEWKPVTGADGNVTDYTWSGFNADGSSPSGTVSGGSVERNGATYNYTSTSVGNFRVGGLSIDDGSNIRMNASIWSGGSTSYSFDELDENGRTKTVFESGYLGNATGASGDNIATGLNSKFKDYEFASAPRLPNGSIGDGFLPGEELFGGGLFKAAAAVVLKKVVTKVVLKKTLAAFGAAVVKKELTKDVVKSSKGLLKAALLPTKGKIRFVPREADVKAGKLLKKNGGFVDRLGNVWKKGPSRTKGEAFEWDVQLSPKGKSSIGHLSNDAKKAHVNVSQNGIVTH
jgi:RHS repeat-associated protein